LYTDTITINTSEVEALTYMAKKGSIPELIMRLKTTGSTMSLLESSPELAPAYELSEYADVIFIVEGENRFPAHKVILCAKSDYFARMFRSGLMETTHAEIPMADVSVRAFDLILHAIYATTCSLPSKVTEDGILCAVNNNL